MYKKYKKYIGKLYQENKTTFGQNYMTLFVTIVLYRTIFGTIVYRKCYCGKYKKNMYTIICVKYDNTLHNYMR